MNCFALAVQFVAGASAGKYRACSITSSPTRPDTFDFRLDGVTIATRFRDASGGDRFTGHWNGRHTQRVQRNLALIVRACKDAGLEVVVKSISARKAARDSETSGYSRSFVIATTSTKEVK